MLDNDNDQFEGQREKLAESIGEFVKYWGFKSVHGKTWLYIYTSEQPMTATELVQKLGVTKSLVSMVLSDLVDYKVIKRVDIGSAKSPGYVSEEDLEKAIFSVLREREFKLLKGIQRDISEFQDLVKGSKQLENRSKQLEKMTDYAVDSLDRLLNSKSISTSKLKLLLKLSR